ncbi:putative lysine decarboxylase [Piromyces finnis]|uniref:Putative lysine decarboxylase n=1 Tax=Piromyces finnis TaxID=1754191 RepID=A0A1Y1VP67_9FUNG|nr:putative lysine decarboxylase [Piromyces finnis]|eukprot:ORX60943.1 putative lysine decarboxylase [Piromyces finnis]
MDKTICVYCSSSNSLDEKYYKIAYELGSVLAKEGCNLVYGGSTRGCMGKVAQGFLDHHGKVTGIIPQALMDKEGIVNPPGAEIIVTKDMNIRKQLMEEKANIFIALPGSFGTLDEIIQVIVTKQLSYHKKAIVFLDVDNYYKPLFEMFENFYKNGFSKDICRDLYFVAKDVADVVDYCKNYVEKEFEYK